MFNLVKISASTLTFEITLKWMSEMRTIIVFACSYFILPPYVLKALTSKKKGKGRKEPTPTKPLGTTVIHHRHHHHHPFSSNCLYQRVNVQKQAQRLTHLYVHILPAAEDDSDDMFKPPKMDDDEFSSFERKSGLFSGGKGLFDDDEVY